MQENNKKNNSLVGGAIQLEYWITTTVSPFILAENAKNNRLTC